VEPVPSGHPAEEATKENGSYFKSMRGQHDSRNLGTSTRSARPEHRAEAPPPGRAIVLIAKTHRRQPVCPAKALISRSIRRVFDGFSGQVVLAPDRGEI
jgi:hypothetical protein